MAFDKTNTFTLGKNKRKEKDTHPSHTGTINIDGVEYWLSAWIKEHNGEKFFSGTVKPKDDDKPRDKLKEPTPWASDFDDDIPF